MTRASGFLTTTATLALIAGPALTQEAFDLGEIVVSGNLAATEAGRTGATVEVIDTEALRRGDTTLSATLDRQPGVTYSSAGGPGAAGTLRLRGLDGFYVGVRIDGIDVADPSGTQNAFNFGGLTTAGLGRVEVLKGSQSALYGSEAIAGVIDISTLGAETLGFSGSVRAEAGSFGTYLGAVGIAHKTDRGEIALNLSRVTSDGISARAGNDETDSYTQTKLTFAARHALSDRLTVGASGFVRDAEVEIDRSATDPSGRNLTEQTGARVFAELDAFGMDHTFAYSAFRSERQDPGGFVQSFDGDRTELSYRGTRDFGAATLTVGLDHTEESFETDTDSGDVDTTSALAELQLRPTDRLDVALSLRHDDHSEFDGQTSGRLALAYRLDGDVTLRAVAGTGYRAPSLFERFSIYGSDTLEPEKSRSFEVGVEKGLAGDGFVKATAFYTEIDDLIGFDGNSTVCPSGFGCYTQVDGTTVTQGVELSGRVALNDRIAVFGNYTLTEAENDGDRRPLVPRHDLLLGVDAEIAPRLSGSFTVQHVADVEASAFAPADNKVGDYTLANMSLAYEVAEGAEAYLRVENLFDEDYETVGGYNMPGRAVHVGLRASF